MVLGVVLPVVLVVGCEGWAGGWFGGSRHVDGVGLVDGCGEVALFL